MTDRPTATAVQAELIAAIDGLIAHALDIAGRRLRRQLPRSVRTEANKIRADMLHTTRLRVHLGQRQPLDKHVWVRVPEIAQRYGIDAACLTDALDDYVRELIAAGEPYDYHQIPGVLRPAGCLPADGGKS